MTEENHSLSLSRILSGLYHFILNDQKYKLVYPDISIRYEAEIYANDEKNNNRFNEWINDEEIIDYLVDTGMWNREGDVFLKGLETKIEDHKVDLYKNFLNPTKIKSIRRYLEGAKKSYNRLYLIRHCFDHLTLSGYCDSIKNQYLLIHSIYHSNNMQRVFPDMSDIENNILNMFAEHMSSNTIDIATFRQIARSDLWRNYWSSNKDNIFDKSVVNWTDEQKTLVVLTKMYDSAHEHMECPPDSVFEDDDIFDGWMISQRRENEKSKSKHRTEKALEGHNLGKAQEVYLVAGSKEEVKNIYDLNSLQSRSIIKERDGIIAANQSMDHSHLPDIQRDIVTKANDQYTKKVKG